EHAGAVGLPGAWAGQQRCARLVLDGLGVDRVRGHDLFPLGPLGVADLDRDGRAHGLTVADAPENADRVGLELHPRAPPVAETTPGELGTDLLARHLDP